MPKVVGMHFVCRDALNITEHGNGVFETGFWKVARKHCPSVEYVALHESKSASSYRHGRVINWRIVETRDSPRVVFTVQQEEPSRRWVGGGSGEKGYAWSNRDD